MKKRNIRIATLACAAVMSMSTTSLCLSTEALGNQTLTSAASTAITSVVSLNSSFTSKKPTFKSSYTSTTNAIRLNWNKVSGASGYRIYKYNSSIKKWVKVKTVKSGSTTTARITGLSAGSKYRFKVKAYKKSNGKTVWSKASTAKYAATKPKQVTMKSSSASTSAIRLNWSKVKCDGYKIYQKVNGKYKLIKTIRNSSTTTYKVTGLSSGTKYTFKVRAYRKDTAGKVVYAKSGIKTKTTKSSSSSSSSKDVTWTSLDKAYYRMCIGEPTANDCELVSEDICNYAISKYPDLNMRRNTDLWRRGKDVYDRIYNFNEHKFIDRDDLSDEDLTTDDATYTESGGFGSLANLNLYNNLGYTKTNYNYIQEVKNKSYQLVDEAISYINKRSDGNLEKDFCINICIDVLDNGVGIISNGIEKNYPLVYFAFCSDWSVGSHKIGDEFCVSAK